MKNAKISIKLRSVAGTAAWTYLGFALSLLSAPLLAHTLGADGRGVVAASVAPVQVLSWIAFLGLPRPLAVRLANAKQINIGSVFWLTFLGIFAAVTLFVLAPQLSAGDSRIQLGIRAFAPVLIFTGVAQLGAETLHVASRFLAWNMLRSSPLVVPSVLTIVLYFSNSLTISTALVAVFVGQLLYIFGGISATLPVLRSMTRGFKQDWRFSLRFWFSTVFDSVGGRLDQVLLAALTTSVQLGSYAVAVTCASASGALTQAINHVAFPGHLSESDSAQRYRRQVSIGISTSAISGLGLVCVLAVFGDSIFGPTFTDLAKISAILVVFQMLADQWQLVVYKDSAQMRVADIATSSMLGLTVLVSVVASLFVLNLLSALTMAISMVVFGAVRLCVYSFISRRRRTVRTCDGKIVAEL